MVGYVYADTGTHDEYQERMPPHDMGSPARHVMGSRKLDVESYVVHLCFITQVLDTHSNHVIGCITTVKYPVHKSLGMAKGNLGTHARHKLRVPPLCRGPWAIHATGSRKLDMETCNAHFCFFKKTLGPCGCHVYEYIRAGHTLWTCGRVCQS